MQDATGRGVTVGALGQTLSQSLLFIPLTAAPLILKVVSMEYESMGKTEQMHELPLVLTIGATEERRIPAYDSPRCLEHYLKGTQEVTVPILADVRRRL